MDTVADVEAVAEHLRAMKDELATRHDVRRLGVWRDGGLGEIDVLVTYGPKKLGMFGFIRLQRELRERLGLKIWLVSTGGLKGERGRDVMENATWV